MAIFKSKLFFKSKLQSINIKFLIMETIYENKI